MKRSLTFGWGVSSFFGWGIYGMNLALQLANHPSWQALCAVPFDPADVVLDPLRERMIDDLGKRSLRVVGAHSVDGPALVALHKDLQIAEVLPRVTLRGHPTIGVVFIEEPPTGDLSAARDLALIVAGSTWNEKLLRIAGIDRVTTVLQGVDTTIFHPAPKANLFPGRFVIFSGGKLEFRKGQDIVLAAFRAFRQRHPEALLITAWHSPWGALAVEATGRVDIEPCRLDVAGQPMVTRWAVENGIPAQAIIPLGQVPNIAMAHVLREAHVALFPNRCEGGTNLPAMEAMACGVPVILSENTGHLDLTDMSGCMGLARQGAVASARYDTTDWGESDVDEIVYQLEKQYAADRPTYLPCLNDWSVQIESLMTEIEGVI